MQLLAAFLALGLTLVSGASQDAGYDVNDIFQQVMARMEMSNELPGMKDLPEIDPRDQEYLQHSSLWGHQYTSGGAGEGQQHLTPNGDVPNVHEVKTDASLPAYCEPPNPCPKGYTEKQGCLEHMPNTAEFVREYQERQECMCDKEHMISCNNYNNDDSISNAIEGILDETLADSNMPDLYDLHASAVAKKGLGWKRDHNPFLQGDKLPVAAKKSPQVW